MIATRMRDSAYKRSLGALQIGHEIEVSEVGGDLVLDPDPAVPAVFLSGGIGNTMVRSVLMQAFHDRVPLRNSVLLFGENS